MRTEEDILLAEEFFNHDLGNKKALRDGFTEQIEINQGEKEYASNTAQTHEYARKAWNAEKEIKRLESAAKAVLNSEAEKNLDIRESIEDSLEELESSMEAYGKNVKTSYKASDHTVETHPCTGRMIYNLLDNSIEHGNRDEIELLINEYGSGLEISVEDNGDTDFEELMPGTLDKKQYQGTGTYLIDHLLQKTGIGIEDTETGYNVKIPRK